MTNKTRWLCTKCGAPDLMFYMESVWDMGKQGFSVVNMADKAYCFRCEAMVEPEEEYLDPEVTYCICGNELHTTHHDVCDKCFAALKTTQEVMH